MTVSSLGIIQMGDWISGTSPLDERFIGFVEAIDADNMMKVWVTQSDREDIVGQSVKARSAKVRKLPDMSEFSADELDGMIDLALATKDEAWFHELMEQKGRSEDGREQPSGSAERTFSGTMGATNRLRID
ncbi:IDEAL domain-containing protein [Paenibacillus sp. HB172176]|uniref:IDEAL domain-containing protein n=1 Tax=Paenibacillus sp. HB172176 TaxID=2493690 RepID=UPI00143BE19A|nr:IDEAL domain-containing protein [Paenibacillus sp. HB172176]